MQEKLRDEIAPSIKGEFEIHHLKGGMKIIDLKIPLFYIADSKVNIEENARIKSELTAFMQAITSKEPNIAGRIMYCEWY